MKQLRRSIGRNRVHHGVLFAAALAAGVGCSDDNGTVFPVDEVDSGVTTAPLGSDTSAIGSDDTTENVVDTSAPTSAEPTSAEQSSAPPGTSGVLTSDPATSAPTVSGPASSSVEDSSTAPVVDTTGDDDGSVAPPANMTLITSYDSVAGFSDTGDNVTVVRDYGDSMMSLDIAFTGSGQNAGVNHNYPGGSGDLCGHDLVARIRLTSGTIDGGIQLRVWSDNWAQFSSKITALPAIGLREWVEYRLTWEQAVANDDLGNGVLDIRNINAVGLEFMTFGNATAIHVDVDWIGLVPSDTPCPDDSGPDSGTSTAPNDASDAGADPTSADTDGAQTDVDASSVDVSDVANADAGASDASL